MLLFYYTFLQSHSFHFILFFASNVFIYEEKFTTFSFANFFFLLPANLKGRYRETGSSPSGFAYNSLPALCHAPATLELSFGLGVGGRVGFNISELVDFLLGFTTYDLMNDDLKSKIEEVEE